MTVERAASWWIARACRQTFHAITNLENLAFRVRIPASPPLKCFYPFNLSSDALVWATLLHGTHRIQQPNRAVQRGGTQMHVALRH
jgi:hypothetical protein